MVPLGLLRCASGCRTGLSSKGSGRRVGMVAGGIGRPTNRRAALAGTRPGLYAARRQFGRVLTDPLIGSVFFFRCPTSRRPFGFVPRGLPSAPMSIAHTKVTGLDETRLVALIEPVLLAHGVVGVELFWKTDSVGWVLTLNIEQPDAHLPGAGITVDVCSELSRDLSAVLDAEELIPHAFRLEVGSPGLERGLYSRADFRRFAGRLAKVKLNRPVGEQRALRGKILEIDDAGDIQFETEVGNVNVPYNDIASASLVIDWNSPNELGGVKAKSPKPRSSERDRRNRASKRKR